MIAYRYNDKNIYIGEQTCQLDPITSKNKGKNVYLLPANCTYIKPLEQKENYSLVWNGKMWEYEDVQLYTPYTKNTDNSINVLGTKDTIKNLNAKYSNFETTLNEPYEFNGKKYLSEADVSEGEKQAHAELELANKIGAVNDEYEAGRNELAGYFIKAMLEGDTDTQTELQEEMAELKADYLSRISVIQNEVE